MKMKHASLIYTLVFLTGLALFGQSIYITTKAQLAQYLISSAWESRPAGQAALKAWPWADTYSVAKIEVPHLAIEQYVMNDASGESLAFGPGHLPNSALPADRGHSMIAGHRDSHFDFIQHLQIGDDIVISNFKGDSIAYRVTNTHIMNAFEERLVLDNDSDMLSLITCYPFDSLTTNGPLRWIVEATPIATEEENLITHQSKYLVQD